jgi:hypothetical protein
MNLDGWSSRKLLVCKTRDFFYLRPAVSTSNLSRMAETFEQYTARLVGYTEGKDPIAMQRATPQLIAAAIAGASKEQLTKRPALGKWAVNEIIAHLAEDEITTYWRYRQIIEHNGGTLSPFDQDRWANWGDYHSWDAHEALTLFRLLREKNLEFLSRLTESEWQSFAVHAERGKMTVAVLARHMAGHDTNHLLQIRGLLG